MSHKATLASLLILVAAALPVHAQGVVQPTVTVVPFQITHSDTPDAGADIADDLASQLVESGQYRVLDRAWLPITKRGAALPPVIELRRAATSAGVRYLILGSALRTAGYSPRSAAAAVLPRVPGLPPVVGMLSIVPSLRSPVAPRNLNGQTIGACRVEIQIIDAKSGELIRRMSASSSVSGHEALKDVTAGILRLTPVLAAGMQ